MPSNNLRIGPKTMNQIETQNFFEVRSTFLCNYKMKKTSKLNLSHRMKFVDTNIFWDTQIISWKLSLKANQGKIGYTPKCFFDTIINT